MRSYTLVDDQSGLVFTLDCVPTAERYLDLISGRFAGLSIARPKRSCS